MKALITGASGFVGGYLVRALLERRWDVVALDRSAKCKQARNVVADLATLRPSAFRGLKFDAVFHLAGLSHVPTCDADPGRAFDVHVRGGLRLLRAIPPGPRIVFITSGDIYGRARRDPIPEDEPLRPTNAYAYSKACADAVAIAEQTRCDLVLLRPFNHTGAGQSDRFVAPAFAAQIARAEREIQRPVLRVGNLRPVRDFLDVRDVVRAYLLAFEKARPGIYNVSSDQGTSIRELLDMLRGLSRIPLKVQTETNLRRSGEPDSRVGDSSRFRAETGWAPSIPLRKTLADLLDYERARLPKNV